MSAPLSVIIPTLNAEAALRALLPGLVDGLATGLLREVIVSDGGSTDGTLALAGAAGAIVVTGPPGRGGQIGRGATAARGSWLLVLHADTCLPEGWAREVSAAMARPERAHVFRLSFRASGLAPRLVAGWANLRTRLFGLPYGDQGLLIARPLLESMGGYPDLPLMEDVALARALARRPALLPLYVSTDAARYEADGWLRRGGRNLWLLVRYFAGVRPERLARGYSAASGAPSSSN
ncbi:TIGR04283 family arsenosugar biosynthesis glycosyltransferase [Tropicimonas sp.]|uniref:TIGR04283 family arsenosugar biosynthesis glycosyltransferase n=1 Tax=Tropicimonas sp. TaxID=2067044 RepID=UPI003A8C6E37